MEWQVAPQGPNTNIDWSTLGPDRPVDPYLIWLDMVGLDVIGADNFASFYSGKLPVLLELAEPFDGLQGSPAEVPAVYREPIGSGKPAKFVSARVAPGMLRDLLLDKRIVRVQLELSKIPDPAPGGYVATSQPGKGPQPAPDSTWLGVIDVGCAFAHAKYCSPASLGTPAKSRVKRIWDQSFARKPDAASANPARWAVAHKLDYGAELDTRAIEQALTGWPDELSCYADVGFKPLLESRALHGLGVLDMAAGHPSPLLAGPPPMNVEADKASSLPIVFVQLESLESRDTTLSSLGAHVLDGLRWMIDRVEHHSPAKDGKRDPSRKLVANLSYGGLAGPHDGSSVLECALDELIELRGNLAVVLSAGNAYDIQSLTHAKIDLSSDKPGVFQWQAQPDDPTDNFLEIWFPGTDVDDVRVLVTTPGGVRSPPLAPNSTSLLREADAAGPVLAGAIFRSNAANGRKRALFLLALQPSAPRGGGLQSAPAGLWRVEVQTSRAPPMEVHAWVERDDYVAGNISRRQQSSLIVPRDDPTFVPDHGLNSLAHGRHTIVAGGYCLADRKASDDTGSGPGLGVGTRRGPDVSAPSDAARSTPGLLVSGATTGVVNRMSGTSIAAPAVARWIANWFASTPGPLSIGDLRMAMDAVKQREGDHRLAPILLDPELQPALGSGQASVASVVQGSALVLPS
jgi:Subtilase family